MPLTYAWAHITDSQCSGDADALSSVFVTLNHDITHVRELIADPASFTANVAHDHDGVNSARVIVPSPNLVVSSKWNYGGLRSNFDDFISYSGAAGSTFGDQFEDGGAALISAGNYATTYVAGSCAAGNWGTASSLVVSVFAKATGQDTAGSLTFGLCGSGDAANATFITGCKGTVAYTAMGTGWKRYWFICDAGTVTGTLAFKARVATTFTNSIRVDAPSVNVGSTLPWWWVSPQFNSDTVGGWAINYFLRDISATLPVFDQAIAMDDAVKLTPT